MKTKLMPLTVYKKTSQLIVLLLLFSTVVGCVRKQPPPVPDNHKMAAGMIVGATAGAALGGFSGVVAAPAAAALGSIAGGAIGHYLATRDDLYSELDRAHLQIFKVGQEYMIVLPTDSYFFGNSSHVNEAFYPSLNRVAEFIKQHETESIKVAGYTDNHGNQIRNVALSRQQAQNILNYLWHKGLDARMIYSIGYGEQFPVANNDSLDGRLANRRVQITFRDIPKDSV